MSTPGSVPKRTHVEEKVVGGASENLLERHVPREAGDVVSDCKPCFAGENVWRVASKNIVVLAPLS